MIFSNFFKAKWQHKDANIRLTAIAEQLSVADPEQRTILASLAKSDDNDNVRKAALLKLADVTLYQTLLNDDNKNIQQFASKQVEQYLLENNDAVSESDKLQLVPSLSRSFLEKWLLIENNLNVIKAIYNKIAKAQTTISLFAKKQDEAFQRYLLAEINELSLLEKLLKKTTLTTIAAEISERMAEIKTQQEKPIQLAKDVQLTLSKLLALKDSREDYQEIVEKRQQYEQEWQHALADFAYLTEAEQASFTKKYQHINKQLTNTFVQKEEAYQQALIAKRLAEEKAATVEFFEQELARREQILANAVFENTTIDDTEITQVLTQLTAEINDSVLNSQEQKPFIKRIDTLGKKLQQLPEIAQSVSDATHLIAKFAQFTMPTNVAELNAKYQHYHDWLTSWKSIEKQSIGTLPQSIKSAKEEIINNWHNATSELVKEQKQLFHQARKNINDIKRLIAVGKYNPCFGIFKNLNTNFQLLSPIQQQKLQRDHDLLAAKLDELADWEHYVATPRKQELLTAIQAIAQTPLANLNEQASKVKEFRSHWNALGHADDEVEKALNDQFNQACEQAFSPCREYFAEQEQIREQHAKAREAIITEAEKLAQSAQEQALKTVEVELNKLNKAWRSAGDVDKKRYHSLNKTFKATLEPVHALVKSYHENNQLAKENLIKQATALLTQDDIFSACHTIKSLQEAWREIGFAGAKIDNKLWLTFREINDQLFTKRDTVKQQQSQQLANQQENIDHQLTAILANIAVQPNALLLKQAQIDIETLRTELKAERGADKSLMKKIDKALKDISRQLSQQQADKNKADWLNLFNVLEAMPLTIEALESLTSFQALSNFWQKKVLELTHQTDNGDRLSKTLELEILAGIESPKEFAAARLTKQVDLMQQQMVSSQAIDLQSLFVDWLKEGKFERSDVDLLKRVKPIYC